jgi:hypothetical protein
MAPMANIPVMRMRRPSRKRRKLSGEEFNSKPGVNLVSEHSDTEPVFDSSEYSQWHTSKGKKKYAVHWFPKWVVVGMWFAPYPFDPSRYTVYKE